MIRLIIGWISLIIAWIIGPSKGSYICLVFLLISGLIFGSETFKMIREGYLKLRERYKANKQNGKIV